MISPYYRAVLRGCKNRLKLPVGTSPLDAILGLRSGQIQRDVQQVAADLATEVPYETASAMLERLSGITVSSERVYTLTHQVADGLSVLEVCPWG